MIFWEFLQSYTIIYPNEITERPADINFKNEIRIYLFIASIFLGKMILGLFD